MFNYFKETSIAKSHKLHGVIERHFQILDFAGGMKESEDGEFQESFWEFVRTIGVLSNTDPIEIQLGKSDVYDNAQITLANSSRIP